MIKTTIDIDKITIKRLILAYISSQKIKKIVKEVYTGINEEPCQDSLFSDLQNGISDYMTYIFKNTDFEKYEDFTSYIANDNIDIDIKTEIIYGRIQCKE